MRKQSNTFSTHIQNLCIFSVLICLYISHDPHMTHVVMYNTAFRLFPSVVSFVKKLKNQVNTQVLSQLFIKILMGCVWRNRTTHPLHLHQMNKYTFLHNSHYISTPSSQHYPVDPCLFHHYETTVHTTLP